MKRFAIHLFLISIMGMIGLPSFAQNNPDQPGATNHKLKPIDISYTTLTGLCYSVDHEFLGNDKDFEGLIFSLNDYESTRLLKRSESSASTGQILRYIGLAGLLTGVTGILAVPSNQQTPFWLTAIGAGLSIDISGFFQSESQTTKFNCVQRYNRFARGEEQVLPKATEDEKSLLYFDKKGNSPEKKSVTK